MVTTTSTPVQQQGRAANKVILRGVSWQTFKALMADVGDDRAWRIAYDGGVLEIRMPLEEHEEPKRLIESFVEAIVRGKNINLPDVPPPDLVVESDYTNYSVNKDSIYAALGVTELWRYEKQTLLVYQLVEGQYQQAAKSLAFPFLPIAEVPGFIERRGGFCTLDTGVGYNRYLLNPPVPIGQRSAVRLFRQRMREILHESS